ncbi:hypothetical protein [Lacticaseibacillus paracasei]|uniref:hypothetical protein n=1 Tax=Lacticaseibacillus paracasei TaxID=1597 RepID=UPI0040451CB5
MYILSVLLLLMTIPAMIYGVYRWIRYRKKETRRLKGKHIFFLSLILFFLLPMYISTFPEAKQQSQEEHQQEISRRSKAAKRSKALASSKAAKRSKALASSKAAKRSKALASSKAAKRSKALASSKAAKRSRALASSKAAADAQAAAASKAAADTQAAAANQQTNTSGYFRDRNGRWRRPNGQFASKQEILNAGLSW